MIEKICEICSNKFRIKPYRKNTARFCSQVCGGKWHMLVRNMPNDHKHGNKWRLGKRPANAFTSEQAKAYNIVQGLIYKCFYCSKQFERKPWIEKQSKSKSERRFCSSKCHGAFKKQFESGENSTQWCGGKTTYRGKGWIEARKLAVNRDNGTCQECQRFVGYSIPVHHKKPFRLFKSAKEANLLENLLCLCQSCHMKIEHST